VPADSTIRAVFLYWSTPGFSLYIAVTAGMPSGSTDEQMAPQAEAIDELAPAEDTPTESAATESERTSVASVNSALQRARATLEASEVSATEASPALDEADAELLDRYVAAFEAYDMEALTSLIREDAIQSMPPFDLWLRGRDDIFTWWLGPGIGCKGSRVIPTVAANGSPAFGQYKPAEGGGYEPWALQVLEIRDGKVGEFTFFLDTETLFPLFGLPARLDA